MQKRYSRPFINKYKVSPCPLMQYSVDDTDIPVVGGGTEEFDAKGGIDWDDEDDSTPSGDNGLHVHFGY